MPTAKHEISTQASISYAALRHGGEPPGRARTLLGLKPAAAQRLERLFQAKEHRGADAMRPKFARHEAHVAAVQEAGGFPALRP